MAVFNEILVGRFSRGIQRIFSMKGGAPTPAVASDIFASFDIMDPAVDLMWLLGWNLYAADLTLGAGGAGNNNNLRLRNPVASNVLCIIEKVTCQSAAGVAGGFAVQIGTPGLNDLGAQQTIIRPRDTRQWPPPNLTGQTASTVLSGGVTAGAGQIGSTIWSAGTSANQNSVDMILDKHQEIVLAPGWELQVLDTTLNSADNFTVWWRERFIEESERA